MTFLFCSNTLDPETECPILAKKAADVLKFPQTLRAKGLRYLIGAIDCACTYIKNALVTGMQKIQKGVIVIIRNTDNRMYQVSRILSTGRLILARMGGKNLRGSHSPFSLEVIV